MEIRCPNCKTLFTIDSKMSENIVAQIKDAEFQKELEKRVKAETETIRRSVQLENEVNAIRIKTDAEARIAEWKAKAENAENQIRTLKAENEAAVLKATSVLKDEMNKQKSDYELKLSEAQVQVDYYKDLKTRMSTKMVGETLEQHCATEFNRIRGMMGKNIYFEKDNVVSKSGSKGDFIYREQTDDGVPVISIMFEMKNEMETTAAKHKNEYFFKELDKERREKNCEVAVLVTMLEPDNEVYNQGIVDVSYQYPNMYVIRPQFFIPLIMILRNAAMSALETKRELMRAKAENLDITNFEERLNKFKDAFSYNYTQASKRFKEAVAEIDKAISNLQEVKEKLLASDKQLSLANSKADEITIKKLTYGNPTMAAKLKGIEGNKNTKLKNKEIER